MIDSFQTREKMDHHKQMEVTTYHPSCGKNTLKPMEVTCWDFVTCFSVRLPPPWSRSSGRQPKPHCSRRHEGCPGWQFGGWSSHGRERPPLCRDPDAFYIATCKWRCPFILAEKAACFKWAKCILSGALLCWQQIRHTTSSWVALLFVTSLPTCLIQHVGQS